MFRALAVCPNQWLRVSNQRSTAIRLLSTVDLSKQHGSLAMGVISDDIQKMINPPAKKAHEGRRKIDAIVRTVSKTRQNERLRQTGRVPGVLHGKADEYPHRLESKLLHVDTKELCRNMRELGTSLENTAFDLVLTDEATGKVTTHLVTPRQLTLSALTDSPTNVNWLKWVPGCFMRIPFTFINTDLCVDLKRGSFLLRVNHFIECICEDPDKMPAFIEVDLSGAAKGSVLTLKNMVFPDGVRPSHRVPQGFVAGVIKNK